MISNPLASELLPKLGDGSAVSLQLIGVGKRHCRLLRFYDSGVTGIDMIKHHVLCVSIWFGALG